MNGRRLLEFVDVAQDASRDADDEGFQIAPGLVLHPARHINYNVLVQFDFLAVQEHLALAFHDIIEFVRALVVVELGIGDFDKADISRGSVLFLNEKSDLAASFSPGLDVGGITSEKGGGLHRPSFKQRRGGVNR
jgi:hypothetical protein